MRERRCQIGKREGLGRSDPGSRRGAVRGSARSQPGGKGEGRARAWCVRRLSGVRCIWERDREPGCLRRPGWRANAVAARIRA
jgi:hypothetical protein